MTEAEQLFEQVYRTYGPSLYRFCLIQMKNPADAEDILQEVFCKRLYRAPVFASPDHERRWLFRVALNQCRDAWKRSSRSELPLEAASAAVTPEELGLLDHVAALPESQRTVLHLHYYEGYTLREIARLLGVTVPTVKMRLKRGRDALRNTWEESLRIAITSQWNTARPRRSWRNSCGRLFCPRSRNLRPGPPSTAPGDFSERRCWLRCWLLY